MKGVKKMSNNAPQIRFKGFTDAWEQRKLGELGELKNGMNFDKEAMGHGYPFVNLQDVFGKTSVNNSCLGLAESSDTQRKEYSLKKGDVLFIRSSVKPEGVGEAAVVPYDFENTTYSGFIIRFRPTQEMSNDFKQTVFSTKNVRLQIMANATSSANTNINQQSLQKIRIILPCVQEQIIIGNFFHTLDNLITLHKRKLDSLKQLKKGYLQNMFPHKGKSVPKIRFVGFADGWETKKLGDVIESELKGKAKAEMCGSESAYLDANYLNGGKISYVDSPTNVNSDDVLILWDGSQAGTVYYGFEGALGSTLKAYRPKYSGAFLYQQLKKSQQKIYDSYRTPNIPHVVKTFTDEFVISVSTLPEQIIIGDLFHNLDNQINTQKTKMNQLKQLKSAYLQKMFV